MRLSRTSVDSVVVSLSSVRAVSVSDDLRTISFESFAPLPSGASFSVSGIKVIAYNRYSPLRGFDLDIGSDGVLEAYDPNGIRVTDEYGTQDTTVPQEPAAVTGTFLSGSVILSASPSGDLDFENFRLDVVTASGTEISTSTFTSVDHREVILPTHAGGVLVRSVDRYGNTSSGVLVRRPSPAGAVTTDVGSGSLATSTGSSVSSEDSVTASTGSLAESYVPTYRKPALITLIAGMDAYVARQAKAFPNADLRAARLVRNDLAKLFESYFRARFKFERRAYLPSIYAKVTELKALFR